MLPLVLLAQSATATVTAPGAADLLAERLVVALLGLVGVGTLALIRTVYSLRDEVRDVRGILVGPDGQNGLRSQVHEIRSSQHKLRNDMQGVMTTQATHGVRLDSLEAHP